jgi:hypothetical protein
VSDDEDLVGLWDSTPFDYGVMESSQLGLLADGTGWGVWSNVGGGMELTLLTWRRRHMGVLEILSKNSSPADGRQGALSRLCPPNRRGCSTPARATGMS